MIVKRKIQELKDLRGKAKKHEAGKLSIKELRKLGFDTVSYDRVDMPWEKYVEKEHKEVLESRAAREKLKKVNKKLAPWIIGGTVAAAGIGIAAHKIARKKKDRK